MVKKESVQKLELGMVVFHEKIYNGREPMKIVGIREKEVELEGDFSGGVRPDIIEKDWLPINGLFRLRKVCWEHSHFGSCTLPNVHCSYPHCEPYVTNDDHS